MIPEAIHYLQQFPQQKFMKGDYITHQGAPVECIYFLVEGKCVRDSFTIKGDEIIYDERVADNTVYSLIGALTLYLPVVVHKTNFVAQTPCVCHVISCDDFKMFLSLYPSVLEELLRMALASHSNLDANFQAKQKGLAPSRICSFLLENALQKNGQYLLDKHFSISAIARYLGMHRTTVSRIILTLCDQDCCKHTPDGLVLLDRTLLGDYALGNLKLEYKK